MPKKLIVRLTACFAALFFTSLVAESQQVWNSPVNIPVTGTGGNVGSGYSKMAVVNGNPAMVTYDATRGALVYIRATDATGSTWGSLTIIDGFTDAGTHLGFCVVNGNPAVSYYVSSGSLKYIRANDANGTTWGSPVIIATGTVGQYSSLCVVNGNPAISYYDAANADLKYVRAGNANGTAWNTPLTLDATGVVGAYTSMAVVNGNPAISYYDGTNHNLKYINATDVSGTAWASPLTLDATDDVGLYSSLCVVNGRPAIAYKYQDGVTNNTQTLKYIRASDADGTSWGASTTVDNTTWSGTNATLQIANGNPAIVHYNSFNGNIVFIRGADADGSTWNARVIAKAFSYAPVFFCVVNNNPAICFWDNTNTGLGYFRANDVNGATWGSSVTFTVAGNVGQYTSLQVVNGYPAMSYYDLTNGDLKYIRSATTSGSSWNTAVTVVSTNNIGQYTSLCVVNSNPAISYYDVTNGDLYYVRASDVSGTAWNAPIKVDGVSSDVGGYTSLQVINGNPAISYYDVTNGDLYYARATDASGTTWGTPVKVDGVSTNVGQYTSLAVVNGIPAISYYDVTNGDLYYVQASNADGSTWANAPVKLDGASNNSGQYSSLAVVNGNPAISYYNVSTADLYYVRANDVNGSGWGTPKQLDATGTVGTYTSLCVVDGNPAISYYDGTNAALKYIRASNATGSTWASAVSIASAANKSAYYGYHTSMAFTGSHAYIGYYAPDLMLPCLADVRTNNTWLGGTSTDWFTPANWRLTEVPTIQNVDINSGATFYPDISTGTATCNDISIASGGSNTISGTGTLQLTGSISNSGTFDGSAGSIELNGTTAQTISIGGNSTIKNLTLNNSTGATLIAALNLTGVYTPTSGTLTTGGFLTLKSDVNGTARIAAGSSAGGYFSGNVAVERYIPAKRAWRLITSPVTGSTNNSIFYNWQNNDAVTGTTGIEIWTTAANGGASDPGNANSGLSLGGGNSILSYTSGTGYSAVTNTNSATAFTGTGNNSYCVFVSGPYANGNGNLYAGATNTTFKATGALRTGDITVSAGTVTANQYYLVGNPYASPINTFTLSGTNLSNGFYLWDPTLSGSYAVGGYVAYDRASGLYSITSGSYSNTSEIQSGQAFFIQAAATGATSITFEESDKSTNVNNGQFRTTSNGFENLRITLQKDFDGNSAYTNTDGVVVSFHATIGSKDIDSYDVRKLSSGSDLLALVRSSTNLSFEHRPLVTDKDTIYLKLSSTSASNYRLVINAEDFASMAGLTAVLKDNYLNTEANISLATGNAINFSVTGDAASTGERFIIYFRPATILPVDFIAVKAKTEGSFIKVDWTVASEKNIVTYEIERSIDGKQFDKAGTVTANNTSSYNWIDVHPFTGTNYYRIRSVDVNGDYKLSSIVSVKLNGATEFSIYPNPVKDKKFQLSISNATSGRYTLRLINSSGQLLFSTTFDYTGGTLAKKIQLPSTVQAGIYQLEIINGNEKNIQQLIIY
jgi:hypothetical protein